MNTRTIFLIWTTICLVLSACNSPSTPPAPTSSPFPSATATFPPTLTSTPIIPWATINHAVECFAGPGSDYDLVTKFETGQQVVVTAHNNDQTYWVVKNEEGKECWIDAQFADYLIGDIALLPEATPPLIPTPAPPATPNELVGDFFCNPIFGTGSYPPSETEVKLVITWKDNADNESVYQIFRYGNSIAVLPSDTTSFTDVYIIKGIFVDATYVYGVVALGSSGSSPMVEVVINARCRWDNIHKIYTK